MAVDQEYEQQLEQVSNLTGFSSDLVARKADLQSIVALRHQAAAEMASLRKARLRVSCIQRAIALDW